VSHSSLRRGAAVGVVAACAVLSGCVTARGGGARSLRADEFAGDAVADVPAPVRPAPRPPPESRTPLEASEGIVDVIAVPGAPDPGAPEAPAAGASVLVDGTAGYVNNKAIYINDFLEPFADRLRMRAREVPRADWVRDARRAIRERLEDVIQDELLRAEAMASLPQEVRTGLSSYFERRRKDILGRFGGTEAGANEALAQREQQGLPDFGDVSGRSVDEVLEAIKRRELIAYQLGQRIRPRAHVPWRDVSLAYERDYQRFNPAPTALFRIIRVPESDAAGVERVGRELAAGTEFAALAADPVNTYEHKTGGENAVTIVKGSLETTPIFPYMPTLDSLAHTLKPGQVAGPVKYGGYQYWLKFEELRSPAPITLYEAQYTLEHELSSSRFKEELLRYVARLKERASYTNIDEMTERLLAVAAERYYPATQPQPAGRPGT
jgi:hypothetical protein